MLSPVICVIIAIATALVFLGVIFLIRHLIQRKYNNFVLQNSICLKQLNEINQRYSFYPYKSFDQCHTYDNEKMYDTVSCTDYLIYQLQFKSKRIFSQITKISENKKQYSNYLNEIKAITQFGQFQAPIGMLKLDNLIKTEERLLKVNTLCAPATQFNLTVTLYCSTIDGRIYDKKSECFSVNDLFTLSRRLNNKSVGFYNDREIWDAICRVERGRVSNKMRFSIYERDGYRCCKCGISASFAQLAIDHILPIAKGGKAVYENLQTLCHKCNVEKGVSHIKYR